MEPQNLGASRIRNRPVEPPVHKRIADRIDRQTTFGHAEIIRAGQLDGSSDPRCGLTCAQKNLRTQCLAVLPKAGDAQRAVRRIKRRQGDVCAALMDQNKSAIAGTFGANTCDGRLGIDRRSQTRWAFGIQINLDPAGACVVTGKIEHDPTGCWHVQKRCGIGCGRQWQRIGKDFCLTRCAGTYRDRDIVGAVTAGKADGFGRACRCGVRAGPGCDLKPLAQPQRGRACAAGLILRQGRIARSLVQCDALIDRADDKAVFGRQKRCCLGRRQRRT